jgi:hypothetical protein
MCMSVTTPIYFSFEETKSFFLVQAHSDKCIRMSFGCLGFVLKIVLDTFVRDMHVVLTHERYIVGDLIKHVPTS